MNKPATVAYVLRKFPVISETFILNEILSLEKQGIKVHIFALERPNDPRYHKNLADLKATITYVPEFFRWKGLFAHFRKARKQFGKNFRKAFWYTLRHPSPSLFLRFLHACYVANHAKKMGVSHYHSHFATRSTSVSFFASMLTDTPFSFTAHAVDIFKTSLSPQTLKKKIEKAKFVVTVSDYNVELLRSVSPESSDKIHKVLNGIDLSRFMPPQSRGKDPFTFLCVARLVEKKGHQYLLEACRDLRDKGHRFSCLMVGSGRLQKQIEDQIREYKLQNTVHLLGPHSQDEVLLRYHQSNAFVLPCCVAPDGNKDGLPVSMVEALACGLPVITTPMTGNPEVIKENENGHLVPFEDPEALANAMQKLLTDKSHYQQLSERARPSVEEQFNMEKTSKKLAQLFCE